MLAFPEMMRSFLNSGLFLWPILAAVNLVVLKNSMHVLTGCTVVVEYSFGYALFCTAAVLGMHCSLVMV